MATDAERGRSLLKDAGYGHPVSDADATRYNSAAHDAMGRGEGVPRPDDFFTDSSSTRPQPSTTTRSSTASRSKPSPASPAAQLLGSPTSLTVVSPGSGPQFTGVGKAALVFVILMIGLDIYARATGSSFTLDLLNPAQLFGGSDQSPVTPQQGFTPHATPPSATSPGATSGGGRGLSMAS
jgi:hypothetical protein